MTDGIRGFWFVLVLGDMRQPGQLGCAARARTSAELEQLLGRERRETYQDGPWRKTFRKGGPFEFKLEPELDPACGIHEVYAISSPPKGIEWMKANELEKIPTVEGLDTAEQMEAR